MVTVAVAGAGAEEGGEGQSMTSRSRADLRVGGKDPQLSCYQDFCQDGK